MKKLSRLSVAILIDIGLAASFAPAAFAAETSTETSTSSNESVDADGGTIVVNAAQQTLQAPGVSTITADEIKKRPPARDVSEIIRTMPGVNLTGNSTSGQRGNNRQIDIRGMGPENTLILIDGRPVTSRNSVRLGWRGERDTRGDTSWVPPEMIERIEVIRGPAAARYGNGAAGGVVNIITKKRLMNGTAPGIPTSTRRNINKKARPNVPISACQVRWVMISASAYMAGWQKPRLMHNSSMKVISRCVPDPMQIRFRLAVKE